jgi:sugar phosphate isomerase/epimerase
MQLGISTYSFPWSFGIKGFLPAQQFTASHLLQYAGDKKIGFVQFGDNYPLHNLDDQHLIELKNEARQRNIKLQPGTRKLTFENVSTYISIAEVLEADFIRVVIDDEDYHPSEAEVIGTINKLLPVLRKSNVILALENHDRFPATTLKRIIDSTDDQFIGICLDTVNSFGAGESVNEVVSTLAPYTVNIHVKDFEINRKSHTMGFHINGCVAGTGMLNIPSLIKEIAKNNRCSTATLEVWSDPEQTIEESIRKEKNWVEKSIDYLKTILS